MASYQEHNVETILYVDDEPEVLRAFERDLKPWTAKDRFRITTAETAADCLRILEDRPDEISLVISDLRMPRMKGSDLLMSISKNYPDIGLMLLTAYSDMGEITKAVSASIQGLVLKPWEPAFLRAEIERTLDFVRIRRNNQRYLKEIQQQLKIAGEFQKAFLRPDSLQTSRLRVDAFSQAAPGLYVNGDYHDVIELDEHRCLLLIGDVSGHGVRPAFVSGILKLLSRRVASSMLAGSFSPAHFLASLNEQVMTEMPSMTDVFVSCVAVYLDSLEETALHASAGHPPGMLLRGNTASSLDSVGPALGFSDPAVYKDTPFRLRTGDRIVLFSDGLFDDRIMKKSEYSTSRLGSLFMQADHGGGEFVPSLLRLLQADLILDRESPDLEFHDDLTILSAKVVQNGP